MRFSALFAICCLTLMIWGAAAGCRSADADSSDSDSRSDSDSDSDSDSIVVREADQVAAALSAGQARWRSVADDAGQSYFYWRVRPAGESGEREVTGVQVVRGQATRRYLTRSRVDHANDGTTKLLEQREESAAAARARPNAGGYPPLTLDELYASCSNILPKQSGSPQAQQLDFELRIDSRGVPVACWVLEKGCQGDCVTDQSARGLVLRELATEEVAHFLSTTNPDLR